MRHLILLALLLLGLSGCLDEADLPRDNPLDEEAAALDFDGDGVANAEDNCPFDRNPNQADEDSDGYGDFCDPCWSVACGEREGKVCGSCTDDLQCVDGACEDIGLDWYYVPGGIFSMGSQELTEMEQPVRQVNVDPFEISQTEVTVRQFRACVESAACTRSERVDGSCEWDLQGHDRFPIRCVTWPEAVQLAEWVGAGARLCSEAEWERAAVWQGSGTYPWGSDEPTCEHANTRGCGGEPLAVCSLESFSPGRPCDLIGNVAEWMQDAFHESYEGAPSDGAAWEEPLDEYGRRMVRGGSYDHEPSMVQSARRSGAMKLMASPLIGIRLCRDLQ